MTNNQASRSMPLDLAMKSAHSSDRCAATSALLLILTLASACRSLDPSRPQVVHVPGLPLRRGGGWWHCLPRPRDLRQGEASQQHSRRAELLIHLIARLLLGAAEAWACDLVALCR